MLSVPTFEPPTGTLIEFPNVVRSFLATAFYFKKTSLVTDLRENGQPINNYNGNCTGLSEGVIADVEAVAENGVSITTRLFLTLAASSS